MKQVQKNKQISKNRQGSPKKAAVAAVAPGLSKGWMIPLVIAMAVIPLITVVHSYDCGLEKYPWFSVGGQVYDFFLFYKAFFLRLLAVVILFFLAYLVPFRDRGFLKTRRNLPPTIAIGVFGIFSLGSAILSAHKGEAFFGGYEQYEGWLVILAYVLCFFLAFGYARTVELIRFLLDALLIGATIIGLLGFFQAFGIDWIQSGWAKSILGMEVDLSGFDIRLNFGVGKAYATLYNPNYVGSYVALVFPFIAYLVFRGEKIWRRVLSVLTCIMLIVTLFASDSKTGVIGLVGGGVVCLIFVFPYLKKVFRILVIAVAVVGVSFFLFMFVSRGIFASVFDPVEGNPLSNMTCEENLIHIELEKGQKMDLELDTSKFSDPAWATNYQTTDLVTAIRDASGNPISYTTDENGYIITNDENYPTLGLYPEYHALANAETGEAEGAISLFHINDYGYNWSLIYEEGQMKIYNDFGRTDTLEEIRHTGFEGHYRFASRRGYIWSRTIPMLWDHLIFGAGPDQFVYAFPNNDYVGKKYMDYSTQTVTKPHDTYLQIWVQDGLICLLAYLFLFGLLFVRAFRLCYGKNKLEGDKGISFHSFTIVVVTAATAYLITSVANDSTITVAPIYWTMLGAGYAAESMCRKDMKKRVEEKTK